MELNSHSGMIVDSSFSSRKKLYQDLQESKLIQDIYEAKSIADALDRLTSEKTDICFVGPTVSISAAINFTKSAKQIPLEEPCAFVAVIKDGSPGDQLLLQSQMNGILQQPYDQKLFSSITLKAIRKAHFEKKHAIRQIESTFYAIENLTKDLRQFSERARNFGQEKDLAFQQKLYGNLRSSINASLHSAGLKDFTDADSHFTRTVTEWFFEASKFGFQQATENLRLKLLSNISE